MGLTKIPKKFTAAGAHFKHGVQNIHIPKHLTAGGTRVPRPHFKHSIANLSPKYVAAKGHVGYKVGGGKNPFSLKHTSSHGKIKLHMHPSIKGTLVRRHKGRTTY